MADAHVYNHVVHEPIEAITTAPATLADLYWQDKAAVLIMCAIGGWLLAKPWFDQRRRDAAIADAKNVVSIMKDETK
jgi:hypothetical protein